MHASPPFMGHNEPPFEYYPSEERAPGEQPPTRLTSTNNVGSIAHAYRPPVVSVSSLYSTSQCILSMVGSIGVILLFAGIPQLIYSPTLRLSNLMTFLLGASLITAMVAGNAFVNYKYRQYLQSRNQAILQSRRMSRERREAADKPPNYDDLDKLDDLPPDYNTVLDQKPPRYEDLASLYKWSNTIDKTASCSSSSQPPDVSGGANNPEMGASSQSNSTSKQFEICYCNQPSIDGSVYEGCCYDYPELPHSSSRKQSIASMGDVIPAPVHKMFNRFKRSKSYAVELENSKSITSSSIENTSKFASLKKVGKVFNRSYSEENFSGLPLRSVPKYKITQSFNTGVVDEESTIGMTPNEIIDKLVASSAVDIEVQQTSVTAASTNINIETSDINTNCDTPSPKIPIRDVQVDAAQSNQTSLSAFSSKENSSGAPSTVMSTVVICSETDTPSRKDSEAILTDLS